MANAKRVGLKRPLTICYRDGDLLDAYLIVRCNILDPDDQILVFVSKSAEDEYWFDTNATASDVDCSLTWLCIYGRLVVCEQFGISEEDLDCQVVARL